MATAYPPYYEEAAHIARVLTDNGMPLKQDNSPHFLLLCVSCQLAIFQSTHTSHSTAGARVVSTLSGELIDEARRRRLDAIAGTLVGNFLLTCRRTEQFQK